MKQFTFFRETLDLNNSRNREYVVGNRKTLAVLYVWFVIMFCWIPYIQEPGNDDYWLALAANISALLGVAIINRVMNNDDDKCMKKGFVLLALSVMLILFIGIWGRVVPKPIEYGLLNGLLPYCVGVGGASVEYIIKLR